MSSAYLTPECPERIALYLKTSNNYLETLQKIYSLDKANINPDSITTKESRGFYQELLSKTNNLSERIDYVSGLPEFNNGQFKKEKEKLIKIVTDLEILRHINETNRYLTDSLNYQSQVKKHKPLEKWFNALYNGSDLVLQLNNQIYKLDLDLDLENSLKIENKPLDITFYNYLPDDISGTLIFWDMKLSSQKYQEITQIDSSDEEIDEGEEIEEMYGYNINKSQKLDSYQFINKSQFMDVLKLINSQNYTPFYPLN